MKTNFIAQCSNPVWAQAWQQIAHELKKQQQPHRRRELISNTVNRQAILTTNGAGIVLTDQGKRDAAKRKCDGLIKRAKLAIA